MMTRSFLFYSAIAAVIGMFTLQMRVFDRPEFKYFENIWLPDGVHKQRVPNEHVTAPPLYALLVATHTSNIGGNVERLMAGVKGPLDKDDEARNSMAKAAQEYGAPVGADSLSVGVYFDEPSSVESARWAMGWALSVSEYEELEKYKEIVSSRFQTDASKQEQVRAVRIGPGPVLKAHIPWRNMFTPMIAPMFHWKRGF
jgi:hypothetical protein